MKISHKILVVEHDIEFGESVKQLLESELMEVTHVTKVVDAMDKLLSEHFDLLLSDLKLSGPTGLDLLRKVRTAKLELPVIIMTSYTSIKCAAQALRLGAADYILKPFTDSYLVHAVARGLKEKSIQKENTLLRRNLSAALHSKQEIIGESQTILELKNLIQRVGPSEATVLIQGESGTGKELVALGIHKASTRSEGRFVPVNCGAIPMELMESEFFGHVKGAFTGAIANKIGLIQEAHGGTLFLDEIAELAPILQVKLLRFIQDKMIKPVGDSKSYEVDVRIIAACNSDLQKEVNEGRMREDLFYRLNVIQISVPPLRQRLGDIELLVNYFIKFYNAKLGRKINKISDEALLLLKEYEWPGNIRELENSIERAIILAKNNALLLEDFKHIKSNELHKKQSKQKEVDLLGPMSIDDYTRRVIQEYQNDYNEIELANLLGIGRKALWMRRNRWGLFREKQKSAVEY
ncbi:MAG: sigma-54 dependent transcriptional regulator [Gammaproteobacteria bacterium]|nr:sigma-54 dependent transcriptional regulator [Gammaproteobacteria bacterium]